MWPYVLCFSVIASVIIMALLDRRDGWREGVEFARKVANSDANRFRVLYNHAYEERDVDLCRVLNGQVEVLRSLETKLQWEMNSRFMKHEDLDLGGR